MFRSSKTMGIPASRARSASPQLRDVEIEASQWDRIIALDWFQS